MSAPRIELLKNEILANTIKRNTKRPLNLLDIAHKISELKELTGSLKNVSTLVGISESTLNKFLSVFKLSSAVKELVQVRKIDSIEIAYNLKSLPADDQNKIGKLIASGKLGSHDVRAIVPFRKRNLSEDITSIIDRVIESKNIKIYSAFFDLQKNKSQTKITSSLWRHFSKEDVFEISTDKNILKIAFTADGHKKLKTLAKATNKSIQLFLKDIINV